MMFTISASTALRRRMVCVVLAVLLLVSSLPQTIHHVAAAAIQVGAGSYNTTRPAGQSGPIDGNNQPVTPRVTANAAGKPAPTNDWWSSLIWQRWPGNPYGDALFAHPLSAKAHATGLGVGAPSGASSGTEFHYGHQEAFVLGVNGLSSVDVKVDGWSDWTVTAFWSGGGSSLKATLGHGLPFVYATKTGGDARISFNAAPVIWYNQGNVIGATAAGRHYALFAPSGATWAQNGTAFTSNLAGKDYFSVAVLPDNTTATLNDFKQYAFAFVTNTQVSWSYNSGGAMANATYSATTTAKEGTQTGTLLALFRHQWLNSSSVNTSYTYPSARGQMKVVRGTSFNTAIPFHGILPTLPNMGSLSSGYSQSQLYNYVNQIYSEPEPGLTDTYWSGKRLLRLALLVQIAEQVGHTSARDRFLSIIKSQLQNWLSAPDGETSTMFHYDSTWGTLIGYPASYGSNTELNDHHFHYGYYVYAAAIVAQYDPNWASTSQWGGMINLIIRDANSWQRNDTMFPFMRSMDPYEGHSWAAGHAAFGAGNNQESSSESMMFNTALILWGSATNNPTVRDFGIYLYTTETQAIEQYWFDVDNAVFPSNFNHTAVGMVWGDGGAHATWFSAEPEMIHGINFLPATPGMVYLGRKPAHITSNYNEIVAENGGTENQWVDIIWQYLALADPAAALAKFGAGNYTPEEGVTKAFTYHWLHNLNGMGQLDTSVTADIPTYNVFVKNGIRTYVAYNPSSSAVDVHFSDGKTCTVAARSLLATRTCTGGGTLPAPWQTSDVGSVGVAGSASASGGTFTVNGAGSDIWGTSDSFRYVYQQLTGDGSITARVANLTNTDAWAKSGVMIRGSLANNSPHALMALTPSNGAAFQYRTTTGGQSQHVGTTGSAPLWVRVERTGNTLRGFVSSNGSTWTQVGSTSISLGTTVYVGLAVTSHNNAALSTATFDNVSVATINQPTPTPTPSPTPSPTPTPTPPPGQSAYATIQAENYSSQSGTQVEDCFDTGGGKDVGWIANGDYLVFNNIDFGATPPTQVQARMASGAASGISGLVEFRLDSLNGPLIGQFSVGNTGGWQSWQTIPGSANTATGKHTLYVVFKSGQPADFVNFNWFVFVR